MEVNAIDNLSIPKQNKIIDYCINNGHQLYKVLEDNNLTYDDLQYKNNGSIQSNSAEYKNITEFEFNSNSIPTVSFFSGAGGLDLGFQKAGFETLVSIDSNEMFCETLRKNHSSLKVIGPPNYSGDISKREEIEDILSNKIGLNKPFEGVFHGGPPCQPFSIASNQRFSKWSDDFKRTGFNNEKQGNLLFDYIWQIIRFKPKAFLIENVTGLKTIDNGKQISLAINTLVDEGYEVNKPMILDAKNYGVPQTRTRLFVVGWRNEKKVDYKPPSKNYQDIPVYKVLGNSINGLPNHITRNHKAKTIKRYIQLKYGERDHLGRVDRLDPNFPSKTVIAGGTGGGGRSHLHPFIPRTLSPRECARLQTFPDNYIFEGPPARQLTQVGNAVPPILGLKLARSIYKSIFA